MTNIVVNKEVSKVIVINKGADGLNGQGVPTGGTSGQVLVKDSSDDYDTKWETIAVGSGDMLSANNLSDVANIDSARNNIGAISNGDSIINALIFG